MMRKLLLFISILFVTEFTFSQQLPHYSLYMFNEAIINPAVVGTKNHDYVTLILRDQWTGFDGAPKTQLISLEQKYDEVYGIGVGVINDKTGPISRLSGLLSGSYRIPFNDNVISFGATGRIGQYKFDNSEITLENDGIVDPAMQDGLEQTIESSITIGTHYIHDDYYVGVSIPNVISSKLNVNKNGGRNKMINHYYVNAGYHYSLNPKIDLEPSLMFKKTGPTPLQMDLNMRAVYDDFLWGGVSYRTKDAIVIMLGLDYLDYRFAYSYDITTSALSIPSYGSHGLMLSYRMKQIKKDYDKDGVLDKDDDCPKIPGLIIFNGCPDRDEDGIIDSKDECPDFPGLKKNNGCPDRDSDGVIDKYDQCPDIPGLKEHNGCPDTDGDGLRDNLDKCPSIKGVLKYRGCPEPIIQFNALPDTVVIDLVKADTIFKIIKIEVVVHDTITYQKRILVMDTIFFDHDKFNLSNKALSILTVLAKYLKDDRPTIKLKITGHTDKIDTDEYNMSLSYNRANAVRNYLVNEKGIAKSRLKVESKGESKPIVPGSETEHRPKNRRVMFEVIKE